MSVKYFHINEDSEILETDLGHVTFSYCTYPTNIKVEVVSGEPVVSVWGIDDGVEMWREVK